MAEAAAFQRGLADTVYEKRPEQRPPPLTRQQLVALSMRGGVAMLDYAYDLKFVVLRNKTVMDFITSDNPAMLTNRLAFDQWKQKSFGIINSGAILTLPLTPRLLVFYFDIGVYTVSIPRGTRFVEIASPHDIEALNHLQCLNANKNLYFSDWKSRTAIASQAAAAATMRSRDKHEFTTLIRDHSVPGPGEAFREGSEEEKSKSTHTMIMSSFVHPQPSHWPSFLGYRPKPVTFSNGSSVGYVRKPEWLLGRKKRNPNVRTHKAPHGR